MIKRTFRVVSICAVLLSLSSCAFFFNSSKYRATTESFTNSLLNRDFDKCIKLMDINRDSKDMDVAALKVSLDTFRSVIARNFGTKLQFSFLRAEKTIFSNKEDKLPPNSTLCLIEYHNDKFTGIMQVLFNDKTSRIIDIKTLDVKQAIPDMGKFWVFALFPIIVLLINIYTIVRVKRSNLRLKWLFYIGIVLLNVPTFQYNAMDGIFFKPLYFQILLGVGMQVSGYFGSIWELGIPLGSIIAIWRLNAKRPEITPDSIVDQYGDNYYVENPSPADDNTASSQD